jgi:toxin ParE1/3/4
LVAIDTYSAKTFGEAVADAYSRGFVEVFELLQERPLAGAVQSDLGMGLRGFVHRRHRIYYRVDGEMVLIVRILHQSQNAHALIAR